MFRVPGSFSNDSRQYRSRLAVRSRSSTSAVPCTSTCRPLLIPEPVGSEKSSATWGLRRASLAFFG